MHGREVAALLLHAPGVVCMGIGGKRGGLWSPSWGHLDDEGFTYRLSAGVKMVECASKRFLGPQDSFQLAVSARRLSLDESDDDIWRVDGSTEGVGVFLEDGVTEVIDQVFLRDQDECGRRAGPFDPDLAVDHVELDGGRRTGEVLDTTGVWWLKQGVYEPLLGRGDERLPPDGKRRSSRPLWQLLGYLGASPGRRSRDGRC